ncbi:hypothetical protein L1049_003951 [Liquidambar formosana]|uniref:Uncharacterized protein n=1 Tax=Liquidambar formosana TaxID=63359 RepID=A0AAP0RNA4_LIQFO
MAISSWLCKNSTKNMLVKIVHPGGHVELHDRPVLAAEIMLRNPKCCVAHPHVFKKPWAIVAPDTMLPLGQKFYVVPIHTIRKLQRVALRYSPSLIQEIQTSQNCKDEGEDVDGRVSTCWIFKNNKTLKLPYACFQHSNCEGEKPNISSNSRKRIAKEMEKGGCSSEDNCFMCLITSIKSKANSDDSSKETKSSSSGGSSETKELTMKRPTDSASMAIRGSPRSHVSFNHWQPILESITEE